MGHYDAIPLQAQISRFLTFWRLIDPRAAPELFIYPRVTRGGIEFGTPAAAPRRRFADASRVARDPEI